MLQNTSTSEKPSTITTLTWIAFSVTMIVELLDGLDSLIATIAGPAILHDLHGAPSLLQTIAVAYSAAMAAGLLASGRLGDIFGRRRLLLLGLTGFALASLFAGLSISPAMLIAARCIQGLTGAVMVPQTFGILRDLFPKDRLGQIFAIQGPVMALAGIAGPLAGGAIVQANIFGLGWRAMFLINLPVIALALLVGWKTLPRDMEAENRSFDWLSALLGAVGLPVTSFALTQASETRWSAGSIALLAFGIAVMALFIVRQFRVSARQKAPLIPASLLANRKYLAGIGFAFAMFGGGMTIGYLVAIFAQIALGLTPFQAGLLTIPEMVGMLVGMASMSRFKNSRTALATGSSISILAVVVLGISCVAASGSAGALILIPGVVLAGFGTGLASGPLFDVIISSIPEADTGAGSSVIAAVQQLSSAFGIAIFGALLIPRVLTTATLSAWTHGFIAAMIGIGILLVVGLCLVFTLRNEPISSEQPEAA